MASKQRDHFGGSPAIALLFARKEGMRLEKTHGNSKQKLGTSIGRVGVRECAPISEECKSLRAGVCELRLRPWKKKSILRLRLSMLGSNCVFTGGGRQFAIALLFARKDCCSFHHAVMRSDLFLDCDCTMAGEQMCNHWRCVKICNSAPLCEKRLDISIIPKRQRLG